ncbi:MAG: hypothetical protein SVU32_06215 [Candidatus Nanohaloarchaea archaeon]|nr:hypothetical protein [Candidatus Nanohaloarchaea archaeon]
MFQSLENEKPELLATLLIGILIGALLTSAAGLRKQPEANDQTSGGSGDPDIDLAPSDGSNNRTGQQQDAFCPSLDRVETQNVAESFLRLKYSASNVLMDKSSFRRPDNCTVLIDYQLNGSVTGTLRISDSITDNRTQ